LQAAVRRYLAWQGDPEAAPILIAAARKLMSNNIEGTAEDGIDALNAWLAKAGLRGEPEAALVSGFCERAVAAGLPIGRAQVLIDTLHPVYEGRLVRWGQDPSQPVVHEYGRTGWPE